ncbi:hypothetical protein JCM3775_003434 [Rhodotorula graminis]
MPPWTASTLPSTSRPRPSPTAPSKSHAQSLPDPHALVALPTPPPSLPTSTPGSPESSLATRSSLALADGPDPELANLDMPSHAPSPAGPRRRKKRADHHQLAHGLANLDEDPQEPSSLAAVPFPSAAASDERPRSAAAGHSSSKSHEGTPARSDSRRAASHSTTTTTTTATRKTERRQVRYSFPGLDHLVAPGPLAGPHRPRSPSTGSSRTRSPVGTGRKSSTLSAPRLARRSSSKHDPHSSSDPPKPRQEEQQQQQRWRSSSSSTPATSSPFFRRSSSASSYAIQRRQSTLGDNGALLPAGSAPFLRPLVNAFAFFVVSAVAALTISAVLATSFSLTFYDDCSRRVGHVQRSLGGSIEGVRAGMGRMIGNARGALDLAVRAAGGTAATGAGAGGGYGRVPAASHSPSAVDAESADRRRTTIPTVPQAQEPELETDDVDLSGTRSRSKRTRSSSAQADSPSFAPAAPSPSKRRRPFFRATPSSTPHDCAERKQDAGAATPGWRTDDDDDDGAALPFRVPRSTPRSSRATWPLRSAGAGTSRRALPPRPPLAVLVPSVIFALLFTLFKVLYQAWKGRSCADRRSYSSSRSRY